jgi:hypothetical protein
VAEQLNVEITPSRIEIEPGATPVEAVVAIQNLGDVVEQYTVEVTGLDSDWFTAPVASIGLFPQDKEQVRVRFHPPRRQGLRAGAYPFQIVVRGRSGTQETAIDGVLDVRGFAAFRVDMTPRRQTARGKGTFRLALINTGTGDVQIGLEARDAEGACEFKFPKDEAPSVAAQSKTEAPMTVRPKSRPWVGREHSYQFTVTARPIDARGQPQTVAGEFTHRPLFESWAPLRKIAFWVVGVLAVLLLLSIVLPEGFSRDLSFRTQVAWARACGSILYRIPVFGPRLGCAPGVLPRLDSRCDFGLGFKEFAEADQQLVGGCISRTAYDRFGNGLQYTDRGVLFWQKDSNTVYFFLGDSVWANLEGKPQLLNGSGRR